MFNCTKTTTIRRLYFLALLCICLGAESATTTTTTRCMERENQALLKLKDGFTDESGMLSSWVEEDDCCKWKGISCDNTTGHVTMLNLRHPDETTMRLAGTIHPSVCELQHLTYLDLSYNYDIGGKIPDCFGSLSQLRVLKLGSNDLNGSIPYGLQNLSHLQTLDIGDNSNLVVKDLEWVSHLSSLKYLDLSSVDLSQAVYWQSSLSKVIPGLIELNLRNCSLPQFHHNSVFKMNTSSSLKVLDFSFNGLNNSILSWVFNVSKLLTHLDLSYNFLEGSILDDFANMVSLERLDLSRNKIVGGIPKSFQHMCNLQELIMPDTNLGGSLSDNIRHLCPDKIIFLFLSDIPFSSGPFPDFTNFTSLERLLLDNTSLSGEFPQFFGHFPNLSELTLNHNNLSGSLPEFIGLPSLLVLDLSNNQFSGSPSALTQLSSLNWLYLYSNNISGVISEALLSNLPNLTLVDVSHNLLQFKFSPKWIPPFQVSQLFLSSCTLGPHFPMWLKNQKRLRLLDISNAGISDLIPQWFWDQSSSIVYLNVSHNHIIGSLPKAFSNIKLHEDDPLSSFRNILDLSFNNLSGPMPLLPQNSRIVILSDNNLSGSLSSLCKRSQTYLSYLDLSNNLLSGSLPNCWDLLQSLEIIDLAHNNFSGRIPNSIGSLKNILTIHLSDNKITGEIPFLKNCQELQFIDFGGNNLHGDFPSWIGEKLPNLVVLRLRDNKLQGSIPAGLCSLVNLQVLDLAQNNIAGKIPNCLNNISILSDLRLLKNVLSYDRQYGFFWINEEVSPSFVDNAVLRWKGQDYEYGKNLGLMTSIDLSHNLLTGEIPHSITSLASLASLNLSRNNFTGFIPDDFGHMKMLESLDLSENSISGTIPKSFKNLSFLAYMNISFNNLSGRIPSSTQLQSFDASTYVGNSGLCGPPLEKECQEYNDSQEKKLGGDDEDESINFGFYISVVLGFIVGFWGIYGSLILSTSWRHKYLQMIENMNDWILALVAAAEDRLNEWHLFSSEDMKKGNKPKKRRQRRINTDKENININSSVSDIFNSPAINAQLQSAQTSLFHSSSSGFSNRTFDDLETNCLHPTIDREPLSNITNITTDPRRKAGTKGKATLQLKETNRNLYNEEFIQNSNTMTEEYHDQLETSVIEDGSYIDDSSDDSLSDFCMDQPFEETLNSDSEGDRTNASRVQPKTSRKKCVFPHEYASLGAPSVKCNKCNALLWKEERVNKNVTRGTPLFSVCCKKGEVKLPETLPTPPYLLALYNDKATSAAFQRSIRLYNAMFSFTSSGGNVDHSINSGGGPYIYRLNGQNHHVFGSLIPDDGNTPKFCQLYIYDTGNEVNNRLRWVNVSDQQSVDVEVVQGLINMLDQTNELCKEFRMARDRFENNDLVDLKVELKVCRAQSGRENHISASDDVAGIMVGGTDNTTANRDIIIMSHTDTLHRVSYIHPKLMALQYPLLFPNGEDGYHNKIPFQNADPDSRKERDMISMKDYYSYSFQVRENEGMTARLGGRLFQQYMVDAFSAIEQTRLWWFRRNQTILRNELYNNICDSVRSGDTSTSNVGRGVILPAGYVGSKRYMQQNFQDALAVCRHVGHPDVFLTMTCNPLWDEIQKMMQFLPGCETQNCPDIISRVFRLKLDQMTADIKKKAYFGVCVGVMYVVEFQKRGLPHVHMLIWLDSASKKYLKQNVDKFVSAEIPDPEKDPVGYAAVKAYMMHGPCGLQNSKSPCMKGFKCIRHFPKKYCSRTVFDESGFPVYMRRCQNFTIQKGKADLDNQWVVPYNRDLLVKYQCHMNIEICCHARSIKYLFKYCLKGHDTTTVQVIGRKKRRIHESDDQPIDEINAYFDGRYVCAAEAAYRIFGYPIHHRTVSVERLPFHLPGAKNCTFRANASLQKVADREKDRMSKLEAFFLLNHTDVHARQYTYDEIPKHYVWNDTDRKWNTRKRGYQIGRLSYTHHSSGEVWYLRMLLTKVRGPTSFQFLRTVNGVCYNTFRDACKEYGLLDDDKEWHDVLDQCAAGGLPPQIRQLFVHIIVNCKVTDLAYLWSCHWKQMIDDILLKKRNLTHDQQLILNDMQLQFYALAEIDDLLRSIGKSLKNYAQLPQPPSSYLKHGLNNLIIEETNYNMAEMEIEYNNLLQNCTAEQKIIYQHILDSVDKSEGGLFFVYGSGGCGKTYLWRTLISKLRSQGHIVLPVATSGIAATLLPGGRTAHSRFKIPILLDDFSICAIGQNSDIAALIRQTKLIIWDEAPMQHRYAFECLDRSLKDIMKTVDPERGNMPFGGITVLLGGDFRQILPVISHGERGEIMSACITRSRLWSICKIFLLTHNMRLTKGSNAEEIEELKQFAQWVLDIGDGKVYPAPHEIGRCVEDDIVIPAQFCDLENENSVDNMIKATYPDFLEKCKDPNYLSQRAILTPTNQTVGHLNSLIVEKLPGESVSYFSVDCAEDFGGTEADLNNAFPVEYLNSINIPGMPPHELKLKVGVVVMLMRNLNQTLGLCNGTRMILTKCLKFCVECEVICGSFVGTRHFIPRMELCPSETRMPFKLVRKQMPLQICYAMTINKAQGQSLETVGLFLPKSVFTHGQFYVAISRVTSPHGLKIFVDDEAGLPTDVTQNVVYREVFYALPRV